MNHLFIYYKHIKNTMTCEYVSFFIYYKHIMNTIYLP